VPRERDQPHLQAAGNKTSRSVFEAQGWHVNT